MFARAGVVIPSRKTPCSVTFSNATRSAPTCPSSFPVDIPRSYSQATAHSTKAAALRPAPSRQTPGQPAAA